MRRTCRAADEPGNLAFALVRGGGSRGTRTHNDGLEVVSRTSSATPSTGPPLRPGQRIAGPFAAYDHGSALAAGAARHTDAYRLA